MPSSEKSKQKKRKMCAPPAAKAINFLRFDVATERWALITAAFCIISSCCCFHSVDGASVVPTEVKYPCAFIDTINVTGTPWAYEQPSVTTAKVENHTNDKSNNNTAFANVNSNSTINSNEHFVYDNNNTMALLQSLNITSIPRELIAAYNFVIKDGARLPVSRHLRACICKLKPCIRFCCDAGHYYDTTKKKCVALAKVIDIGNRNGTEHSVAFELTGMDHREVAVRGADGNTRLVQTAKHFHVRVGVPCERMRSVYRDSQLVHWALFENGTIAHGNYVFPTYYCYTPHQSDNITWEWQPLACVAKKLPFVLGTREWTYAICLILAVICMVIVLFIYIFSAEMRKTFFGVAITVYALCIIIGYSLMAHLTLTDPAQLGTVTCINIAACIIFYLVISYYVLSFIGFNFYMQFHGIILSRVVFWLIFFPIVLVVVGWSIFTANNNYEGKAIFGGDTCWFDPRNWSILIYFYAPILIACVLCIFFYILTLIRISEQRQCNMRKPSESLEENCFKSFLKFFTYTFVMFMVCVTSFAINYYREEWTHINYAVCLFIVFHGFGALYALIVKNQKVQNFLRRIEDDVSSDDESESAVPMSGF